MGPTISAITDGRYDDIEVDEQSLAFKVRAPETGEFVGGRASSRRAPPTSSSWRPAWAWCGW